MRISRGIHESATNGIDERFGAARDTHLRKQVSESGFDFSRLHTEAVGNVVIR
jgi:hypothetical protein